MLGSAVDLSVNAKLVEFACERLANFIKKHLALLADDCRPLHYLVKLTGIEIFHCQILKLTLEE